MESVFAVFVLLPSLFLCFGVLTTFFGPARALAAICWIPITLLLCINLFIALPYQPNGDYLEGLARSIVWTSILQGVLGLVITLSEAVKKRDWLLSLSATAITLFPVLHLR